MRVSPGARAYHDDLRRRGIGHHAALRQLSNRLVGNLHGCLKTGTLYDEHTAWAHHQQDQQAAARQNEIMGCPTHQNMNHTALAERLEITIRRWAPVACWSARREMRWDHG
ncbi:hypothetical protein [Amycolatopsis sp.]|uniref:hypothetical protein n=1 Tax=Amycolatopsis sp. TaxID=37632 RepID=UPI0039C89576